MKKSEQLKIEASQEENDFRAMGLMNKSMREARLERFEDYRLKLEQNNCIIIPFNGQKVVIDTRTDRYGIIDYFPKANKLLIRKTNAWFPQGLKFLISTFIK